MRELEKMIMKYRRSIVALLVGLAALLLALVLCELVSSPSLGHRLDLSNMPSEGKALLNESPGVPLSKEQWSRLDEIMVRHGGWPNGGELFIQSVQNSWYWLILVPSIAGILLSRRWKTLTLAEVILLASPSALSLVAVFFL